MSYLEYVEFLMDEYGMSEADACRCADLEFRDDYDPDDYDT